MVKYSYCYDPWHFKFPVSQKHWKSKSQLLAIIIIIFIIKMPNYMLTCITE